MKKIATENINNSFRWSPLIILMYLIVLQLHILVMVVGILK